MRIPNLSSKRAASLCAATGLLWVALSISGCGGHHHHARKKKEGGARLLVDWPAGRAVSYTANIHNLKISILKGADTVASESLVKPSPVAPFEDLPPGDYKMDIRARETEDESGPIVAGVGVLFTVVASQSADVRFSLTTPVDHLEISPAKLTLEALSTGGLTLTAHDAAGAVTLGNPNTLTLGSSDPTVATSDFTGLVTAGDHGGTTTLWFTDTSVDKSSTVFVTVLPPPSVSLLPASVVLSHGQTARFDPSVVGLMDPSIVWSVAEGKAGGSVDKGGNYTAPKKDGVFHVVATSASRPELSGSAMVVVGSGSISTAVH